MTKTMSLVLVAIWNRVHNTCKHQIKLLLMDGYDGMKLLNLLGTKWGNCYGGLEYEYATMAREDVDGNEVVDLPLPKEADISFPMRGFQALEEELVDEEEESEPYHTYTEDYFLGLVKKGYTKLENLSAQV